MSAGGTERRGPDRVTPATVLVVDDSKAVRRILWRALEGAGYRVEEAADGQQALDACRTMGPDLVLLDIDMPVMDGLATLAALRADDGLAAIPVLFLTARTSGTDVAHGLELGAQGYLRKPCEPVELVARVSLALRSSERDHTLTREARQATDAGATDPLTGVGNRRCLHTLTKALIGRDGSDAVVGVILVDVDRFKAVNDEWGHPVGDVVLRILARRLAGAVGNDGSLVRWGGEEFLALASGLSDGPLVALGERLRQSVGGAPFSLGAGHLLPVTVSAGCASGMLGDFDALVARADAALYEAKDAGRDRVASHATSPAKSQPRSGPASA